MDIKSTITTYEKDGEFYIMRVYEEYRTPIKRKDGMCTGRGWEHRITKEQYKNKKLEENMHTKMNFIVKNPIMTTEELNEFLECEGFIYFEGNKRGNFKQWQELAKDYDLELTGSPNDFKVEVRNPVSIETFIERYNLEHEDSKMYQEEYTVDELKDLLMSQPTEFSPTEINAEKEEFHFSLNESIKILTKSGRFPDLVKELNEIRKPKIRGEYISISIEQALKVLIKALKEDPSYFYSWQANIAMAFQDEWDKSSIGKYLNAAKPEWLKEFGDKSLVHTISNQAAINFLNLLTYERS